MTILAPPHHAHGGDKNPEKFHFVLFDELKQNT